MVDLNNQSSTNPNPTELLQSILRGKMIIAGCVILAIMIAAAKYYMTVPVYEAKAVIMVKSPDKERVIKEGEAGLEFALQTNVELLKSFPLADAAVRKLLNSEKKNNLELFGGRPAKSNAASGSANASAPDTNNVKLFAEKLQRRIASENIRNTNLIEVSVSSPYAEESALLTNTVCEAFQMKNAEWSAAQDLSVSHTIEKQITEQDEKVRQTEKALSDYMRNNEVYEASGNVADLQRSYTSAQSEYDANRVQYEILRKQLAFIDAKLSSEEKTYGNSLYQNVNNQFQALRDQIKAKEKAYIDLALQKGNKDPQVEELRKQLVNMKAEYNQVNRTKIAGEIAGSANAQKYRYDMIASKMQLNIRQAELDNSAREYMKLKDYYQTQLNQLPAKQVTFAKLTLDNEVAKKTYAFLKEKLDETRIKAASNVGGVVVINSAFAPSTPKSPHLAQTLLLGAGIGLLLGIGAAVMKDKYM
jgi:uncharacterized protein involved in exopolysaccharide biosynthesis